MEKPQTPPPRRPRALGRAHAVAALIALSIVSLVVVLPLPYTNNRSIASLFPHPHHPHHRTCPPANRVHALLKKHPLVDGHNDLPIFIRTYYHNHIHTPNFTITTRLPGHVDLPRLQQGQVGGTFWSIYTACPAPSDPGNFSDSVYAQNVHDALQQIDLVHRLIADYPDVLELATTPSAVRDAHARGKVASVMGVEGLHMLANSAATLRLYHALGVRYLTLNHNCNNKYADSALPVGSPRWGGLSADGVDVVREMNRIGMLVDLAHTSVETMVATLAVARAPVMFSHSSAFAICPHPRNVPDSVLRRVKANRGVVMVNFYPEFVHCGGGRRPQDATLAHVADHIMHIAGLIGWEYVGIGTDYDGIEIVPRGLEDVSKFPALFAELMLRGVGEGDLARLAGGNILRVWEEAGEVSVRMKREGVPVLEDVVG